MMRSERWIIAVRLASGVVFVAFGAGKFLNHSSELASFRTYGLPAPALFVIAIGVIEVAGGLLLIAGRFVVPAAVVLAGDMVGAIVVSGIERGELISLTLAPALLVAMLAVIGTAAGRQCDDSSMEEAMEHRNARNEVIYRDVNEALKRGRWPGERELIAFRCECARLGCNRLIEVPADEYERVRENPRWFLVAAGHDVPEGETVVETHNGYTVVEKRGEAGAVAEAADPRS